MTEKTPEEETKERILQSLTENPEKIDKLRERLESNDIIDEEEES